MKHVKLSAIFFVLSYSLTAQTLPQLGKNSVKEVIAAMTSEEKAKLVVGMGFRFNGGAPANRRNDSSNKNRRRDTTLVTTGFNLPPADPDFDKFPEKVPGAAGRTHPIPRLGIPSITVSDGPAGVRISPIRNGDSSKTYYATAFPVGTLLASSWDTALVRKVGIAFGSEVHDYGIDVLLGPALNIHRNPLGGRNFEYYSEDPLVAGSMTAAIVNGIQSNGVGTSIKHFAANNQETNRNSVNTVVSERTLREIYLKGFEIAIKKSQPWTVMSSYNKINGTYASESRELLTNVLRGEWKFKGFVMTDWFGGKDAVAQMNSGNDLLMPGNPNQAKAVLDAINNRTISKVQIDENVERILKIILKSPSFKKYKNSDKPDLKKDAQVTRTAAAEGMVLLKNESGALPLKTKNIALFGNTSYDIIAGGTGSGDVNKAYIVSLVEGLTNAGYNVNAPLKNTYSTYIADQKAKRPKPRFFFMLPPPIPELILDDNTLQQEANDADVAVITLGRNAGEGADRKVENDFNLSDTEHILIKSIATAFHSKGKKVLVVLNIGGVIEVTSWKDDVDAILLAWQPGLEAGNSIADVISGKVNPSGKLATTFPVAYTDVPSAKNFPGKELPQENKQPANVGPFSSKPSEVTYEDGIYVGYRYYNTFNVKPAYEFGYGLSYTNFSYGNLKLSSSNFVNKITATITITNKGNVAGKEVAELYISAPAQKLDKPSEELKAFAKTRLLKPGGSQTLTFAINASDLASFDTNSSSWIVEAGKYIVKVGSSSINFKSSATFDLTKEITTEKDKKELAPQVGISELKK
jgi:beta-glucosidase